MPEVGLHPNDADEEYIRQFDDLREHQRVTFLFDLGVFHDTFDESKIDCRITDVETVGGTIANITMEHRDHTLHLRIRVTETGRTDLSLSVDGRYGGYPMELSWD